MNKEINFENYDSSPQIIVEILTICNEPKSIEELSKYSIIDINQLVKEGYLNERSGTYTNSMRSLFSQIKQYNKLFTTLRPIINFRKNIIQLNNAWLDFEKLISSIAQKDSHPGITNVSESDMIKIEYHIHIIFAILTNIKECLKDDIVKTKTGNNGGKEITSNLINQYSKFQIEYDNLRKQTIDVPKIAGFVDFLRNRIAHGGDMGFSTEQITFDEKVCYNVFCDYGILAESDKIKLNVKENLLIYYTDHFIRSMHLIARGFNINCEEYDINAINFRLKLYLNDKSIKIQNMRPAAVQNLLNNKDFILYFYDLWVKNKNSTRGQFQFNISACLTQIYNSYMSLYEKLYTWILICDNKTIQDFKEKEKSLLTLGESKIIVNQTIFQLNIEKSIFTMWV